MELVPVPDHPALVSADDGRALVIADIHLGLEHELLKKGINLPSQSMVLHARIEHLIGVTGARELILLGDIKHNIPTISALEAKTMPAFLTFSVPYTLIKGNHDGAIESLARHPAHASLRRGDTLFVHGHMRLPDGDYSEVVMGHVHPAIEITDELGKRTREKVWLRGTLPTGVKIVVMPAFNDLITGIPVNRARERLPGPVLSQEGVDVDSFEAYLLDGTCLGTVGSVT